MQEIWKDIKNYEGIYQISNIGRVKNLKKNKILSTLKTGRYNHLSLSKNGIVKNHSIHRLVAEAFISNPNNYKYINHKDENTRNNNANNLEWCSQSYNINYGTRKEKVKNKLSISINQYDMNNNFIKKWDCMQDAIRFYNNYHICNVCKGTRKSANGYIWKYNNGGVYER